MLAIIIITTSAFLLREKYNRPTPSRQEWHLTFSHFSILTTGLNQHTPNDIRPFLNSYSVTSITGTLSI